MKTYDNHTKELQFLRKKFTDMEKSQQLQHLYVNKVIPIRQFSSMVNMMHTVLNNREEMEKLHNYESYCLKNMFQTLQLSKEYVQMGLDQQEAKLSPEDRLYEAFSEQEREIIEDPQEYIYKMTKNNELSKANKILCKTLSKLQAVSLEVQQEKNQLLDQKTRSKDLT